MVDFLHRAGRSGRAGESGKVVVFGKMKGRGSERWKEFEETGGRSEGMIKLSGDSVGRVLLCMSIFVSHSVSVKIQLAVRKVRALPKLSST